MRSLKNTGRKACQHNNNSSSTCHDSNPSVTGLPSLATGSLTVASDDGTSFRTPHETHDCSRTCFAASIGEQDNATAERIEREVLTNQPRMICSHHHSSIKGGT